MLKPLYVSFDNGEIYVVDGHFVAEHAAKHYAGHYPDDEDKTYKENYEYEYNWMINDIHEMEDYMQNKMNWEDLNAIYVGKKKYDYHNEFINSMIDDDINFDCIEND